MNTKEKPLVEAKLLAHVGARKITREELQTIAAPSGTATHQPIAHIDIVNAISETLALRQMSVVEDEYAVSIDGMRMFGILEVEQRNYPAPGLMPQDYRFAIGVRNSNDKTMRVGLTAGYRVIVCDNMAFSGDFEPVFYKHTKRLAIGDVISLAIDRIQKNFAPMQEQITLWQAVLLSAAEAKLIIYDAFRSKELRIPLRFLSTVHQQFFEPEEKAFEEPTFWSLSNAFTGMIKELPPIKQFQVTAKLGSFLNSQFVGHLERHKREKVSVPLMPKAIPFPVKKEFVVDAPLRLDYKWKSDRCLVHFTFFCIDSHDS
jgi:hypothetical protein